MFFHCSLLLLPHVHVGCKVLKKDWQERLTEFRKFEEMLQVSFSINDVYDYLYLFYVYLFHIIIYVYFRSFYLVVLLRPSVGDTGNRAQSMCHS